MFANLDITTICLIIYVAIAVGITLYGWFEHLTVYDPFGRSALLEGLLWPIWASILLMFAYDDWKHKDEHQ